MLGIMTASLYQNRSHVDISQVRMLNMMRPKKINKWRLKKSNVENYFIKFTLMGDEHEHLKIFPCREFYIENLEHYKSPGSSPIQIYII